MPLRDSTACNDDKTNKRNTKRKNEQEVTHPMTPVNVQRVSDALKKKPAAINAIKSKSLALFFFFFFYMCVCPFRSFLFFFFLLFSRSLRQRAPCCGIPIHNIYICRPSPHLHQTLEV